MKPTPSRPIRASLSLVGMLSPSGTSVPSVPLPPAIAMTQTPVPCTTPGIERQLRIWLDPIPSGPDGALPPGTSAPPPQVRGPETHALNVELSLINASPRSHQAQVLGSEWQQGTSTYPLPWDLQPDLSPLNRFRFIQRQLVQLQPGQPVVVRLTLELDGQPCQLEARTTP